MRRENNVLRIIIIIISIVLIIALAYFAYHYISMYIAKKEAEIAADDFEEEVIVADLDDEEPKEPEEPENLDPQEQEAQPTETQPQSSSSQSTRTVTKTTTTYKGYSVIGTIQIPKTNVKSVVVDKITPSSISAAVGVLYGSGLNEIGNTVLAAHNYRNGTFFSNNKKLTNGDKIYITDQTGLKVEYVVYNSYITADTDISYATRDTNRKT